MASNVPSVSAGPTWYRVQGMTCQNCARKVREAASAVAGVDGAVVEVDAGRLRVRWLAGANRDVAGVRAAVVAAGFPTAELERPLAGAETEAAPGSGWRFNVRLGGVVTAFLMVGEWGFGWHHAAWWGWVALGVALPVQVLAGARFYRGAWSQLKRGASNMDTLVALGSTAAFAFSTWVVVAGRGGHVYFMESAAIITLISVGHWLEALASARAAGALRALLTLSPLHARRLDPQGEERDVPVADLLPGDRVAVRPGDRVPADADVLEGASAVDESMLTGEARAVEKAAGGRVFAGTFNVDGRLVVQVSRVGEDTALAHIIAAVERAQNSRAGIQRLADRVSSVFVPVVVGLAAVTALFWGFAPATAGAWHAALAEYLWRLPLPEGVLAAAVLHATSVLIVACPCAMGLATPAAIMAGTNAAARRGILIRDGVALEKAGRIDAVVFDKTGTLTEGRLTVAAVRDLRAEGDRDRSLQVWAAEVARDSTHPIARALTGEAAGGSTAPGGAPVPVVAVPRAVLPGALPALPGVGALRRDLVFRPGPRALPALPGVATGATEATGWSEWRELRGRGIEARKAGGPVLRLGALGWLHESGVQDVAAEQGGAAARGATVSLVGFSAGERLLGLFELRDTLRPEARSVVASLQRDGLEVFVLSGDAWLVTEAVAREAGIPAANVLADVRPEQKSESIAQLQGAGRRVAFVGDGLNDGPALAQADLGIAVSRATDVARESADVVLLRGDLRAIREAIGLAQATLRTIRQNLFWAFFYNAAAVPLAMLGFFSPILCAAAMGLSDLLVIGNALRLRSWGRRRRP